VTTGSSALTVEKNNNKWQMEGEKCNNKSIFRRGKSDHDKKYAASSRKGGNEETINLVKCNTYVNHLQIKFSSYLFSKIM